MRSLLLISVFGSLLAACGGGSAGSPTSATPSASVTADFSLYTENGLMVTMTDRSSNAASRSINWGDGKSGADLVHIYDAVGDYTVTLTAIGSTGAISTKSSIHRIGFAVRSIGNLTNASPMPLPSGAPTGTCTLQATPVEGQIRYRATMSPGGSAVQFYLLVDGTFAPGDVGCRTAPGDPSCPRGIGAQIVTNSQDVFFSVGPAKYCLFVRNLSTTAQNINGPVDFIAPFIP